jgi:hypothetical protein
MRKEGRKYRKFIGDFQLNFKQDFSTSILCKLCQNKPTINKYELMTDRTILHL